MHKFDADIKITREPGTPLKAEVSDQWSINNIPNGGYIMALMANAMDPGNPVVATRDTPPKAPFDTCIITVNYMDRCAPSDARLDVESISESGNFIRKQARLIQDGRERIRAMGTFVKPSETPMITQYESAPDTLPPRQECLAVPAMPGFSLLDNVDMRMDPACCGWVEGKLTDRSLQQGWIRFREPRPTDIPAVTLFCDAFPPCVFASRGMRAWIPTIEYSVNVRGLPKTEWLKGFFRTRFISAGLVEEDGELWDEDDNLIAVSRQIAKYRERST